MTTTLQRIQFKRAVKAVFTGRGADGLTGPPGPQGPRELFDSVADMKAASLSIGSFARTAGYFISGDGGGSDYKIVASGTGVSDDAFFIVLNNGNEAKLLLPDPARMHVRQAGLIADGVTDDSARIPIIEGKANIKYVDLGGLHVRTTLITSRSAGNFLKNYYDGLIEGLDYADSTPGKTIREQTSIRDTAIIRDRTKSPVLDWARRNVLWLGTSIPQQGGDVDSYPTLACQAVGAVCRNMSWAGTRAAYDVTADPFLADTTQCLSMTADDVAWGLATYGPTSAYDDSIDALHKPSEMHCNFRIEAPFQTTPFTVVFLDHNHNDRHKAVGTLNPESHSITAIGKGATTTVTVNAIGTVVVGNGVAIEVIGIDKLHHFAGRVQAVAGNVVTLNINSSSFAGSFVSGTLYKLDRATICGGFEFLIHFIKNMSIRYADGNVKIILSSSWSDYSNGTDDRLFFPTTLAIKSVADKWALSFYDVAYYFEMTLQDQLNLTYAPDTIHPLDAIQRRALSNHWAAWMAGGRSNFQPDNFWLVSGIDKNYQDQFPAFYSKYLGGFDTLKQTVITENEAVIYSDNFTFIDGGWSVLGAAPTLVAAPWGGGQAAHFSGAANTASGYKRNITIGNGRKVEMDLWYPKVAGFAVNQGEVKTLPLFTFQVGASNGYYSFQHNIKSDGIVFSSRYFQTPGTDFTQMQPPPVFHFEANRKYRFRAEMYKAISASNLGAFIVYIDDVLIGGPWIVIDYNQTAITKFNIGIVSSNMNDAFELYAGNLVISQLDVRDFSKLYTGNVNVGGNQLQIIHGMIIDVI